MQTNVSELPVTKECLVWFLLTDVRNQQTMLFPSIIVTAGDVIE
jgi:hypothetical protein